MTGVELKEIAKQFGSIAALWGINLEIKGGELFFLLGPSGCGKTTLLRIIAGLERPTEGRVSFDGEDVTDMPTERRNAVMCFQGYALWPHMTVEQNVGFGLNVRGIDRNERKQRVGEILQWMKMQEYASVRPSQLSGGQQQRVALARALVTEPRCLLLDEPLSNLDAQLRQEMRAEIRRVCKERGVTTIYVTHDQTEALSVADRIAVINQGHLEQVGTPAELYHRPANSFIAKFIGNANVTPGKVIAVRGREAGIQTDWGTVMAEVDESTQWPVGRPVMVSIRPEAVRVTEDQSAVNLLRGRVISTTFLGEASEHVLEIGGRHLRAIRTPPIFTGPTQMSVAIEPKDVQILRQ
ncbi:MAG TPA: ABC transporter ATP-binding protein [Tepidisphaeraceae bacterium]|nr:ABC transporter ATP-binding protein [Tepidisphaeraceae bacterium]